MCTVAAGSGSLSRRATPNPAWPNRATCMIRPSSEALLTQTRVRVSDASGGGDSGIRLAGQWPNVVAFVGLCARGRGVSAHRGGVGRGDRGGCGGGPGRFGGATGRGRGRTGIVANRADVFPDARSSRSHFLCDRERLHGRRVRRSRRDHQRRGELDERECARGDRADQRDLVSLRRDVHGGRLWSTHQSSGIGSNNQRRHELDRPGPSPRSYRAPRDLVLLHHHLQCRRRMDRSRRALRGRASRGYHDHERRSELDV